MPYKTDVIWLTQKLLRFNTINPPGNERPCAEYLGNILKNAGFGVKYHEFAPDRTGLVAIKGGCEGKKPLCLAGHIDTVPLGTAPWQQDPFSGGIFHDKLYGRGSSDMKSGIAAIITAAVELADRLDGTAGLCLILVAGEETGCEGSAYLAGLEGETGEAGALIVAEPTGNLPVIGHKGALWLRVVTQGITAHGSMPEKGDNAVIKAAAAVMKLNQFDFGVPPHPHLGKPTLNIGTIAGGINVNSVPDEAVIGIDIRTIPGMDHKVLVRQLREYLEPGIGFSSMKNAKGLWTDPSHPWIQEIYDILTPVTGSKPGIETAPYFTDAGFLAPAFGNIPTVIMGPGEASQAHQTDEYCYVERIHQAVEIYMSIVIKWCDL